MLTGRSGDKTRRLCLLRLIAPLHRAQESPTPSSCQLRAVALAHLAHCCAVLTTALCLLRPQTRDYQRLCASGPQCTQKHARLCGERVSAVCVTCLGSVLLLFKSAHCCPFPAVVVTRTESCSHFFIRICARDAAAAKFLERDTECGRNVMQIMCLECPPSAHLRIMTVALLCTICIRRLKKFQALLLHCDAEGDGRRGKNLD